MVSNVANRSSPEGQGEKVNPNWVICDSNEGRFCTVCGTEIRLKCFEQAVESEVVLKVDSNNFLKDLGEEWEIKYGPEICKDFKGKARQVYLYSTIQKQGDLKYFTETLKQ